MTGRAALGLAVVVLLVGEVSARVIAPSLPPQRGPLQELLVKDQQIGRVGRAGGVQVLFAGSSTADAGVDPARFDATSATFDSSYNAALKGMPIRLQGEWLDQVLPRLRPQVVVLDLQPTLVIVPQGEAAADYLASLSAYQVWLKGTADAPLARLDRWLSSRSVLVRDRQRFQQPSVVGRAVGDLLQGDEPDARLEEDTRAWVLDHTTDLGRTLDYADSPDAVVEDRSLAAKFDEILGWDLDLGDADRLIADLQRRDVTVVVSIMPIDLETLGRLGLRRERYDAAVDRIEDMAAGHDVPVWELGADLQPLDFHDKIHIADAGTQKVSDELARRLDELCADGACDRPS